MTLPYKPVSWIEEPVATDKLAQMANNDQWLYENTPRMKFQGYNLLKTSGLKILATYGIIAPTTIYAGSTNVYFGSFFSVGCQPIVVAQTIATNSQRRFHINVNGIGRAVPDHTGATLYIVTDEPSTKDVPIRASVYVHTIAIGW